MLEEYKYIPNQGKLTAICRTAHDGWQNMDLPQLTVGESYSVEYAIICPSRILIGLSAFPKETFNSAQFSFCMNDDEISLIWDYRALKRLMNDNYRGITIVIYDELSTERISEIKQRYNDMRIIIRSEIIKGCPNYKDKYVELWESLKSQIEAEQNKVGFYHPLYKEVLWELLGIYKDMRNTQKTSEVEKLLTTIAEQEV